jgi:hypothetical protein
VAVATGRDVLTVARDSYALTLYTHWHLEQRRRLDLIARKSERFDLAGLMAAAYHEPTKLTESYRTFMDSLRPAGPSTPLVAEVSFARQLAVIRAAHTAGQTVTTLTVS